MSAVSVANPIRILIVRRQDSLELSQFETAHIDARIHMATFASVGSVVSRESLISTVRGVSQLGSFVAFATNHFLGQ